eukprot:m.39029 g.39029  ORF g.39029 m.39029 type:complete len:102 (-) comp10257_c0_seq4:194-499(-)
MDAINSYLFFLFSAAWTTMVMSFLLFSIGTALYFPRLNNLWDYIVTISFLHIFISATVMLSFPVSGLWWGTLIALVVLQLLFSRAVQFLVNKKFPLQTHVE